VADPGQLEALNLSEVLNWAGTALNRVDRATFFDIFEEGHALQYFYEPFLEAFDSDLRKTLGVWYTPPEVVQYMVARVETLLREELGIEDGFADLRVYVLDPCCGTGTYLAEVLKRIATTLQEYGGDALLANDLKRAAMTRVFGFEILPAPFVVAHLQLGLLLQTLGAPLSYRHNERVGVYLTNALTGWEPPTGPKVSFTFPEFEAERAAADRVKRNTPILVILGNPPYDGVAGVAIGEERALSNAYRTTTRAPAPQGQGLNDLYVRFFRMAERRIVEQTRQGVVCFISNYSWLSHLSFTGMRERYLDVYDSIWIDNLHGDRIISEYAPDGRSSETIFALRGTSPGIKVGTAISLFVARGDGRQAHACRILYRDMDQSRASERRAALLESLDSPTFNDGYTRLEPVLELGLPLKPQTVNKSYLSWPLLPELFPVSFSGVKTSRDDFLVDIDREKLVQRIQHYLNPSISHDEMRRIAPSAMESTTRFNASLVRDFLHSHGVQPPTIVRYCYRPFDIRWLYWEPHTKLQDEKRTEYFPHVFDGNVFLFTTARTRKSIAEPPLCTRLLNDMNCMDSSARGFPLYLLTEEREFLQSSGRILPKPNLSNLAAEYLTFMDATEQELFYHCMGILHSRAYRKDHMDALRHDWPRIPLPAVTSTLRSSDPSDNK
jgi:predicted helicase